MSDAWIAALRAGSLAVWVGSDALALPPWPALLAEAAAAAREGPVLTAMLGLQQPPWALVLAALREALGDAALAERVRARTVDDPAPGDLRADGVAHDDEALARSLRRRERRARLLALARAVWCLGADLVLTTSPERLLAEACPAGPRLREGLLEHAPEDLSSGTCLWHLLGSLGRPGSLRVCTAEGPVLGAEELPRWRAALREALAGRSVLLLGAADLPWAAELLAGTPGPHFALAPADRVPAPLVALPTGSALDLARRLRAAGLAAAPPPTALRPPERLAPPARRPIRALAWRPDGRALALAVDHTVRLVDREGRELACLLGHVAPVTAVAWSASGALLASGDRSGALRLWRAEGRPLDRLSPGEAGYDAVASLAFDPRGDRLLAADLAGLRLWDLSSGTSTALAPARPPLCAAFSPDGRAIAVADEVGALSIHAAGLGAPVYARDAGRPVTHLAIAPDGDSVAVATLEQRQIRRWRLDTGEELPPLTGVGEAPRALAYAPDGALAAADEGAGVLRLWRPSEPAARALPCPDPEDMSFAPDGALALADRGGGLWIGEPGALVEVLQAAPAAIVRLAFRPGDDRLVLVAEAGAETAIYTWRPGQAEARSLFRGPAPARLDAAWSPDGSALAHLLPDGTIEVRDGDTLEARARLPGPAALALAFDAAGGLWTLADRRALARWDLARGVVLERRGPFPAEGDARAFVDLALSEGGRLLVRDAMGFAYQQAAADAPLLRLPHARPAALPPAPHPRAPLVAVACPDHRVDLLDQGGGAPGPALSGHAAELRALAWSPDGRRLASAAADGTIRVWRAGDGAALACLEGHLAEPRALAWRGDGRLLASGAADGEVRLWDMSSGTCSERLVREGQGWARRSA